MAILDPVRLIGVGEDGETHQGIFDASFLCNMPNMTVYSPATQQELTHMLNTLPFDITFVAKDDTVRFFSQAKDRIFPRTKAIIGRNVSNCHPPASVHVVEQIVEDFKSGKKDQEDFWIKMGDKYVMIQYFAVRDEQGEYLGVVEVTQDIKGIQGLTGEKRLVTE